MTGPCSAKTGGRAWALVWLFIGDLHNFFISTAYELKAEGGLESFGESELGKSIGQIELDNETITRTANHLESIVADIPNLKKILLVGNFANSLALQKAFRNRFDGYDIVFPNVPGECVARGAVILGNRPMNVAERRAAISYGVEIWAPFVDGIHPASKKKFIKEVPYCRGVASWLIKYGEAVPSGKTLSSWYHSLRADQTCITFQIYEGHRKDIEYIDDRDCRKLGTVTSAEGDAELLHYEGDENKLNKKRKSVDEIKDEIKHNKQIRQTANPSKDETAFAEQLDPAVNHKIIVACDFGTFGCGYAWGFTKPRQNLKYDTDVFMNRRWQGKTLTAAHFHNNELVAFGQNAVERVVNLKSSARNEYLFLQRFKMQLYSKESINEGTMIEDETTKEKIPAVDVIAACLREIKKCAIEEIIASGNRIKDDEILWVVPVPAIWREDAKRLMRLAAVKAGLTRHDRNTSADSNLKPRDVYDVADCGGGTVDVTVHEVVSTLETKVKEAIPVSGGHWGSTVMDGAFFALLEFICGREKIVNFKQKKSGRWHQLIEEWEKRKCGWDGDENSDTLVMLSPRLAEYTEEGGLESFNKSELGKSIGEIELDNERLVLSNTVMNNLAKEAVTKTVDHVEKIVTELPQVTKILLVGNFANSRALQKAFRDRFDGFDIVVPNVPGEVVARGAVILGNRPMNIAERRAAFSYGGVHPPIRKQIFDKVPYCRDVASWLIKYGERVPFGKTVSSWYRSLSRKHTKIGFEVFEGQRKDIEYIDDPDCRKLGYIASAEGDPDSS
ncbi:hypothetical protein HDU76_012910 [Blyttiomyces sp. JEL0837]|nr:hypothetical protein HDU76_012910 [Blyttiomyces sp. JEL0837]